MSTAIMASRLLHPSRVFPQFDKVISLETGLMSGERLDLIPSFYTCLLPIKKVQHELVTLYFQYIHPMFPVVDECYFMGLHRKYRSHYVHCLSLLIILQYLSEVQLQRSPYRSVHEGQEAQFDQVKVSPQAKRPILELIRFDDKILVSTYR